MNAPNIAPFPTLSEYDETEHPTWIQRRLLDLGIYTMPVIQPKQPGFYVNFTTIAALAVIIGFIAGGFWWTWQQGKIAGYETGKQEAINQQLADRLAKAEADAAAAQKLQTYQAGIADVHGGKQK